MERPFTPFLTGSLQCCPCGGVYSTRASWNQHKKTKMHQRWEDYPQRERFDEDDEEGRRAAYFYCKCGGRVANDCQSRYQHRQTQRHRDLYGN